MARNKLAGKHSSYLKRGMSPAQIADKLAYDKEYQSTPDRIKYRTLLNKKNRNKGNYGNGDKKDESHTTNGKTVLESQSKNRARNRGRLKTWLKNRKNKRGKKKTGGKYPSLPTYR